MRKEILYELPGLYRDSFRVTGYVFGEGEKSVCIVGSCRGNEYQQIYTCSQILKELKLQEERGHLAPGKQILVIPTMNPYSFNIKKRFWSIDNTDINRMFPGYDKGETTQRIAAAVFKVASEYTNGIQLTSFYMPGIFAPHISVMHSGMENLEGAMEFGLPYVMLRSVHTYDTTTLNYNWQVWETNAYSLYTKSTDKIDQESCRQAVHSVMNFLNAENILTYHGHCGYRSQIIDDRNMIPVRAQRSGIFSLKTAPMREVQEGEVLAEILDPFEGEVIESITAPVHATVFFAHDEPMTYNHTAVFKLIHMQD